MKQRISEQAVMFYSVAKWSFFAVLVGLIVGIATHLFLQSLDLSANLARNLPNYFLLAPLAFFASAALIKYLAPDAEGHGTEKVIEAVHQEWGKIKPMVVPVKLLATIVTIAFGGSVGKEGPCAQIGSGLASLVADFFRLSKQDRRKIVVCGISAGFAAIFGTPIGGAIFGIEVLFVGRILYDLLLPSLIAGIVSFEVSVAMGTTPLRIPIVHTLSNQEFVYLFAAGTFFGLIALMLIIILEVVEDKVKEIKISKPMKGILGGIVLVALVKIFSTRYLGLGFENVENFLGGTHSIWYDAPVKALFSAVTLGFGGSGGILTPVFFVGSSAGNLFANILHLSIPFYTALGMMGVLAAATNTPIACIVMTAEIFGPEMLLPAAIVCAISYLVNGHNSVYPSQILAMKKSSLVDANEGEEMRRIETKAVPVYALMDRQMQKIRHFSHMLF